jgi:hypothetical protein
MNLIDKAEDQRIILDIKIQKKMINFLATILNCEK